MNFMVQVAFAGTTGSGLRRLFYYPAMRKIPWRGMKKDKRKKKERPE